MATTHEEALATIEARFGSHPGHRALHAKGVICDATFIATPEAARLTRALHMSGKPIPATARISNGSGDPTVPDYAPDVRGLAVAFHLPDGTRTDLLSQTLPRFPFRDQEGFFAAMRVSKPSPTTLLRMPWFLIRHPSVIPTLRASNSALASLAGFAERRFYPFHAFRWVDAEGGERYVRYTWLPTVDASEIDRAEAKRRGRDFLFEDLRRALDQGPVRWQLEVQIAAPGDDPDDPSAVWPDNRERVVVGELEVSAIDADADDGIVFDPMRLVDGIEPSDDPVLRYRPPAYDLSHRRRTGG